MKKSVLIFPGGMPRALEFLNRCNFDQQQVIGASSLGYDTSASKYPSWIHLPYVTTPEFNDALKTAVKTYNIGSIFTPNIVVWNYLNHILPDFLPGVHLVNGSPVEQELGGYRTALEKAQQLCDAPLALSTTVPPKKPATPIELASLFRHAELIPGMCDHDKFLALCDIARHSVSGDIVEIGSWWGKSAFILARLAHLYSIGKLLCVDPWSNEHLVQKDESGLVDSSSCQVDANEALLVFEMNLLPYSHGHVNYLRLPSVEAARKYGTGQPIETLSFGTTKYSGHISILHIDGNHSLEAAASDLSAWTEFVCDNGWIILDDYIWPYGDGPKIAGDAFLEKHSRRIKTAFIMGSALFMQWSK